MSIVRHERVALLADEPVIDAPDVRALSDAVEHARGLAELQGAWTARLRAALDAAREEGHAQGLAAGRAEAGEELARRLHELDATFEIERRALRERSASNALAIVRRIAASLGEPATLAALALGAACELEPDAPTIVEVHPSVASEVQARLEALGGEMRARVEADDSVPPGECRVRRGRQWVLAGLETQLGRIEARLLEGGRSA